MSERFRTEHDSMGELQVPADALWGAQTQRAVQNFPVSGQPMPRGFIRALGLIKAAAAGVNAELGLLPKSIGKTVQAAALQVAEGSFDAQFPIDVYQTGSGTSSNMNANEVIATLATRAGKDAVHPNDHVNLGQSSNDVVPTAIRVSALLAVQEHLQPALKHLRKTIDKRAKSLDKIVKTGRTHLMDAMPLTFGQEFGAWSAQLSSAQERIDDALKRLRRLPLGGTAIGTGINADPRFGGKVAKALSTLSGARFESAENKFEGLAAQDDAVELSGQLNALAVALIKIANDLRWMNAGPLAGLGENRTAGAAAWQLDHARQGQSGDSRSHRDGVRAGDRPPHCHHHRRANRQLPVERDVAADRLQPAGFDHLAGQRFAPVGRHRHCRSEGASGARPRGVGPQPHLGDGTEPHHRLRKGRGDRQACLQGAAVGTGCGQGRQRARRSGTAAIARPDGIDTRRYPCRRR